MASRRVRPGLVYSTELGRTCPDCSQPISGCRCEAKSSRLTGNGTVRVGREIKGRGGKAVTLVTGLPVTLAELQAIATRLKKRCGTGGTVKNDAIEIQGDHRDTIVTELVAMGFAARRSGG